MKFGRAVEQVFVRRVRGDVHFLLVVEEPSGSRHRETVATPVTDPVRALSILARHLVQRSDVVGFRNLRVREEASAGLIDRPEWGRTLRDRFRDLVEA